jgi:hypothetical protein
MKDYYDLWVLAQAFEFEGELLAKAIRATFDRRKTSLPPDLPLGLSSAFAESPAKRSQWRAFVGRTQFRTLVEPDLGAVVACIARFLMPPAQAAFGSTTFAMHWPKKGPWLARQA